MRLRSQRPGGGINGLLRNRQRGGRVLQRLGLDPARVLAVGDSLHTDIAGASGVDLACCWVLSGVHGAALSDGAGGYDYAKADEAARGAGLAPVATLPRFQW